jgi:hypothetical protein
MKPSIATVVPRGRPGFPRRSPPRSVRHGRDVFSVLNTSPNRSVFRLGASTRAAAALRLQERCPIARTGLVTTAATSTAVPPDVAAVDRHRSPMTRGEFPCGSRSLSVPGLWFLTRGRRRFSEFDLQVDLQIDLQVDLQVDLRERRSKAVVRTTEGYRSVAGQLPCGSRRVAMATASEDRGRRQRVAVLAADERP